MYYAIRRVEAGVDESDHHALVKKGMDFSKTHTGVNHHDTEPAVLLLQDLPVREIIDCCCLLLKYLLQSCSRGERGIVEDSDMSTIRVRE
jgi:hypothetical protein